MTRRSIRVRLTVWYVVVLAIATLSVGGGSWWLLRRSVIDAADSSLRQRFEGIGRFIGAVHGRLPAEEVRDEFQEYADLTPDSILLQVTDSSGRVLIRPTMSGWGELVGAGTRSADPAEIVIAARELGEQPFRVASGTVTAAGQRYEVVAALSIGPADRPRRRRAGSVSPPARPVTGSRAGAGGRGRLSDQPSGPGAGRSHDAGGAGHHARAARPPTRRAAGRRRSAAAGGDVQ